MMCRGGDLAVFSEVLHRLYGITGATEFPRQLMGLISELLPADYISYDHIDLKTGAVVNVFDRPIPLTHEEFMARWRAHCHEHPGIVHLENGGTSRVFKISDFL